MRGEALKCGVRTSWRQSLGSLVSFISWAQGPHWLLKGIKICACLKIILTRRPVSAISYSLGSCIISYSNNLYVWTWQTWCWNLTSIRTALESKISKKHSGHKDSVLTNGPMLLPQKWVHFHRSSLAPFRALFSLSVLLLCDTFGHIIMQHEGLQQVLVLGFWIFQLPELWANIFLFVLNYSIWGILLESHKTN